MIGLLRPSDSIRRRLVLQLLAVAATLAVLMFVLVRTVADAAVEKAHDNLLGAATLAIAEELRGGSDGLSVDIPYAAFAMLGAAGQDRMFYRILIGEETVTGYADLPAPAAARGLGLTFHNADYLDLPVRMAVVNRSVQVDGRSRTVQVLVAQTLAAREALNDQMAYRAAGLALGFFALAALLSVLTARSVLQPLNNLAEAVGRRGPHDLRPVSRDVPSELAPLMGALNGFISRLRGSLSRTETLITEAAHHVRTPLASLRTQTEIALRQSDDDATRATLRGVIRAVDDSARSAGQLLDHATVVYRSDQQADDAVDLTELVRGVAQSHQALADMRDIEVQVAVPDAPVPLSFDRLLLESALRNLIDNAIKYSDPGGEVEVALTPEGVVTVLDRGRGLKGVDPATLTGRFLRGQNVEDVIGSGLGLTIVSEVAKAQGGSLQLVEREGGGVCATWVLHLG